MKFTPKQLRREDMTPDVVFRKEHRWKPPVVRAAVKNYILTGKLPEPDGYDFEKFVKIVAELLIMHSAPDAPYEDDWYSSLLEER